MPLVFYSADAFADLDRLETVAPGAAARITRVVALLDENPLIGRSVEADFRELVISRGKTGYVALYGYDEHRDTVIVYAIRHAREAGYGGGK